MWLDRDGNDRYTTEVVVAGMHGGLTLLDKKQDSSGSDDGWGGSYGHTKPQSQQDERSPFGDNRDDGLEDNIPW
jgi:single-strand DNA-binding protein